MMSFRTNLQYLRAQRNMTQERLAMLLGVSRQAISKWESEKAYPEMDKLLMICDLFGCTLDDLVLGDVSVSASQPDSHGASATGCGTTVGGVTGEDAGSPAHAGNAKGSIGDADEPAHLGAAGAIEPSLTGVPTGETPYGTGSPRPAVHANTATLPQAPDRLRRASPPVRAADLRRRCGDHRGGRYLQSVRFKQLHPRRDAAQ